MNISYKNSKYIIWLYGLTNDERKIIMENLPKEHFDIKDIVNDISKFNEISNYSLLDKPDIIICDINCEISKEIKQILYKSYCSLAKVTTNSISVPFSNTFELNNEKINLICKEHGEYIEKTTTNLENSINKIIEMCQISNIEKLQQITEMKSNNILKETKQDDNNFSKEYFFRMAKQINILISLKDNYTAGHCERVATYAEALGVALNMDNDSIEDLILAAYLHDVGKLGLPDAVIKKTSGLNDLEYNIMKKHVEDGTSVLPENKFQYLKSSIRGHHEKYDGSGYPDGLKGDEIPLFAQILAIADSFDAMTSQRSYNRVKSAEEAFIDLKRHTKPRGDGDGQGLFYNPVFVDKFINIMRQSKTIMDQLAEEKAKADLRTQEWEAKKDLNGGKHV